VPRLLVALVGLALVGCGAADRAKAPRVEACPSGTAEVGVKDVLPAPPAGTEIVPPDRKSSKPIETALRNAAGESLRSLRTRVVVKRGRAIGTLVVVFNGKERAEPRDLLLGAKEGAEQAKVEPQPLTVADEDGVLVVSADGATAAGTVGDCSGVMLFGPTEAEVLAVAEKLQRAE
jgi:hypothetical protein